MYQFYNGKKFQTVNLGTFLDIMEEGRYTDYYKTAQVHHTASPSHTEWHKKPDGTYWAQAIDNYHRNGNGWKAIGEHININPNGTITLGRNFAKTPAGIAGHNTGSFMAEIFGNFNIGKDKLQGVQYETVKGVYNYFYKHNKEIIFHRQHAKTDCPGTSIDYGTFIHDIANWGKPPTKKIYRVQVGAFEIRENAEALSKTLKKMGFDNFIVEAEI